jgi:hypothetical protein
MGYDPDECLLCYCADGSTKLGNHTFNMCLKCLHEFVKEDGPYITPRVKNAIKQFSWATDEECHFCGEEAVLLMEIPHCGGHVIN